MACNFSFEHYTHILKQGLESGYSFCSFNEISSCMGRACVLRHDVDYKPENALKLASIEHALGIRSSYFFLLNAEMYNLREQRNYAVVHEIAEMGHAVGLHLDITWNPLFRWDDIEDYCRQEQRLFQEITCIEACEMISFHNPHKFTADILNRVIPGIRHTYEPAYFSQIKYLSDSQGWYEGCPCRVFRENRYEKLQLLTHGYIWSDSPQSSFIEDMAQMVSERSARFTECLISAHPICARYQDELRAQVRSKISAASK